MLTNRERDDRHAATLPPVLPREHHPAAAHGQGLSPADLSTLWKDFAHAGALLVSGAPDLKAV
ncbi:hypothetical protein FUT69_04195 [Xylella taiwanensis]|uniref:Uncharacterized protein n=1 Tax=Xylella taiwanensis TaxID=1444770 RepID=A0ABS8TTV5_9GAMM|nr:hypothetical protein [Xylella taiwanensis]AXI84406.1 hypothetical protein AB672_10935 [Xylella taiwanensis]MCD8472618.1 hypothetical protein [Xylella taiwanensis]NBI36419.1 hypothetical protein [Xylella taiwanensis]QKD99284.1 hypothetical protein PLS229_10965 [Xylella taiwanensis]UFM94565.1 hypothetical protein LPH39_04755 [Xylella taiwanensis]